MIHFGLRAHGHVHQNFFHLILQTFHLCKLHGLCILLGLAPDFDSLGPYQIFVLDLQDAWMP